MMRVRVDQKTLVSFMIPFAICIAAGGLLMLAYTKTIAKSGSLKQEQ